MRFKGHRTIFGNTGGNLVGLKAGPRGIGFGVKKALAADVATEISHAQQLAQRIKTIGGRVPGSLDNKRDQTYLQPPADTTDVIKVIKGVIKAEEGAIAQYNKIIKLCDGRDYVTQDMAIGILSGEEDHRREFLGFLTEYTKR